jgi:hypothetical protein
MARKVVFMSLDQLIPQLREFPLDSVLQEHGLYGKKEGHSIAYRSQDHAINVTGARWFDHKAGTGGYGAIDLVLHLRGGTIREACTWLAKTAPLSERLKAAVEPPSPDSRLSFAELMKLYGVRDDRQWPHVREYLTKHRLLPEETVEGLHWEGCIYANFQCRAVFLHSNTGGEVLGASIRAAQANSTFQQTIGDKTQAWFRVGNLMDAKELAIVESPIDALSYWAFNPNKAGLCVVSAGGSYVPKQLLELAARAPSKVTIALDNDTSGHRGYEKAKEDWREIHPGPPPAADAHPLIRSLPQGKDWNDDLRTFRQLAAEIRPQPVVQTQQRGCRI